MEKIAYISLKDSCNASCPMCLSWKGNNQLSSKVVQEVISALAEDGWSR
ncbi:hypothetical protein MHK_009965, partial [Candidatus Magnetomorum sp. HK-1]